MTSFQKIFVMSLLAASAVALAGSLIVVADEAVPTPSDTGNLKVSIREVGSIVQPIEDPEKVPQESGVSFVLPIMCSPDGWHAAAAIRTEAGSYVRLDGVDGKHYEKISDGPFFTPDSKHLGYIAESGGKCFVVVDDKEGKQYDRIAAGTLVFSPDSTRVAYVGMSVTSGQQACAVVDAVEGKWYPAVNKPIFSPDSKHVAYLTGQKQQNVPLAGMLPGSGFIVVDGKEVRQFDKANAFVWSPDSAHWACDITVGNQHLVVQDGVDGKPYEWILCPPIFSPDSKHLAYIVRAEGKEMVVKDGVEEKGYDRISPKVDNVTGARNITMVFSPDGQHLAYAAQDFEGFFVVQDGVEGKKYAGGASLPIFSPDSKHTAYIATGATGASCLVQDGVEGPKYWSISQITFSPDSSRLAYAAAGKSDMCVVLDGVEGKKYKKIDYAIDVVGGGDDGGHGITFTSDSKHIIYFAKTAEGSGFGGGKMVVVVDSVEGKEYAGRICNMRVSPDGKHVTYFASLGQQGFCVVDGTEVQLLTLAPLKGLIFDSPTKCHGILKSRTRAFLIEIEIAP